MSLNYNLVDTLKLLLKSLKFEIMIAIIISIIISVILLILNKNNKKTNYIVCLINLLLIILKFNFSDPMNNIYF